MKELIAGRGPVKVTEQEAREALAWCDGRPGWIPTPGRLPFFGPYAVSVVPRASRPGLTGAWIPPRDVGQRPRAQCYPPPAGRGHTAHGSGGDGNYRSPQDEQVVDGEHRPLVAPEGHQDPTGAARSRATRSGTRR